MPKSLWLLVIGMMINVTGASFLWPLNAIYIHQELGKSLTVAGLVLMINAGTSVVGNLVGGWLFDKIGGYRSIISGATISVISLAGLSLWHDWPYYVIFLATVGFGSGMVFPSVYAMAGTVWPEGGRKPFNAIYVAQNVGVALGAALGAFVAKFSFDWIFMANFGMYVIFFFLALFGYKTIKVEGAIQTSVIQEAKPIKNKSRIIALALLCAGYIMCWIGYVQWQSTISTYTQELGISLNQYGLLWTLNGGLIVLGQPLIKPIINRMQNHIKAQMLVGIAIFTLSFFILIFAQNFTIFAVSMIILTIGEMLVWPAVPTIASSLAPEGREGFYQGIVNSTATGGRMIGPLLGGIIVDSYGMAPLFMVLMGIGFLGFVFTAIYDRGLKTKAQSSSIAA